MTEESKTQELSLKEQLAHYFKEENVLRDGFLTSHMDAEHFVPVELVSSFKKVATLLEKQQTDASAVLQALRDLQAEGKVQLSADEAKVRPVLKLERTTLIVREFSLPEQQVGEAEIREMLAHFGCVEPKEVHEDANMKGTFFVEFESEQECVAAAQSLLLKQYKGVLVRCRVKSKNVKRDFFNVANSHAYRQQMQKQQQPELRGSGRRKTGGKKKSKKSKKAPAKSKPLDLAADSFPALPGSSSTSSSSKSSKQAPGGYTHAFRKHGKERMAAIVRQMPPPLQAASLARMAELHPDAILGDARNTTLLDEPFPVMYPASPSPMIAAAIAAEQMGGLPPALDLGAPAVTVGSDKRARKPKKKAGEAGAAPTKKSGSYADLLRSVSKSDEDKQ